MSNQYFDWPAKAAADRFVRFDTVRAEDANDALDLASAGFEKLPTPAQVWGDSQNYVAATGLVDAWSASVAVTYLTAYTDGMQVRVKFPASNTSAVPTLNLNGLGARIIVNTNGGALIAGDIAGGLIATLTYIEALSRWQLVSTALSASAAAGFAADAEASADAAAAAVSAAQFADYAALRAYTGSSKTQYVTGYTSGGAPLGINGLFVTDDNDTTSVDNGGTIIVSSNGKRRKRVYTGYIDVRWFGADGAGGDYTTAVQAAADVGDVSGNRSIYIPSGTYTLGRIILNSKTVVWIEGTAVITRKAGQANIFLLQHIDDTHIMCNGAELNGTDATAGGSHTVSFIGARRCSLINANIVGSPNTKDGVYLGLGVSPTLCEDCIVKGGSINGAGRNGISVVAAIRTVIDGVNIYNTTGAPGAGIDLESNLYDQCLDTEVKNCYLHDNVNYGIVISFCDRSNIHHNTIYNNGIHGIANAVTGPMFATATARLNTDVRAVSNFNTANGEITVSGDLATLPVGCVVQFAATGAGVVPVTFQALPRWIVHSRPAADKIILSEYLDYLPKTTLSDAGAGTLTTDPATSEITLRCYVEGQGGNADIHENYIYGNASFDVNFTFSVNIKFHDNYVYHDGNSAASCVSFQNTRGCEIYDNKIKLIGTDGAYGLHIFQSSFWKTRGNVITGFLTGGISIDGCSRGVMTDDTVIDCGSSGGSGRAVELMKGTGLIVKGMRVSNNDRITTITNGVWCDTTVTESVFRDVNARGAGTSDVNSLVLRTNRAYDCTMRSGLTYLTGNATYDAASLADGVGVTTTVTVTGAALGDLAEASFSVDVQGITVTTWVSAANTVSVRLQNETGAAVDLASATIRCSVKKP